MVVNCFVDTEVVSGSDQHGARLEYCAQQFFLDLGQLGVRSGSVNDFGVFSVLSYVLLLSLGREPGKGRAQEGQRFTSAGR